MLGLGLRLNRGVLGSYLNSILKYSVGDWGINSSRIRLRRDSDNAELEFNSVAGGLDTVGILAWSGSDSVYFTKVFDKSGNGNHAIQTTASYQPRLINEGTFEVMIDGDYGMYFDGVDDRFDVTDNSGLDITTGDLSLLANFDPDGTGYVFSKNLDSGPQYGYYFQSGVNSKFFLNDSEMVNDADGSIVKKIVTFTYNHVTADSYNDAIKIDSNAYLLDLATKPNIQIGCRSASADGITKAVYLTGHINRVAVFKKALTQNEVTYLTSKI